MAKNNRVPAMVFNADEYAYPDGLRVETEDELDILIKSGEWNTGPVDAAKVEPEGIAPDLAKAYGLLTVKKLTEMAEPLGVEIQEGWIKKDIVAAIMEVKNEE